jgi:sulfatase modifying factor 1
MRFAFSLIISVAICLLVSSCASTSVAPKVDITSIGRQSLPPDLVPARATSPNMAVLASGSDIALARQAQVSKQTTLPVTVKSKVSGITFSLIPPGSFKMGSRKSEYRRDNDEKMHSVTITQPFYMGKLEITQAQWQKVMGVNPAKFRTKTGSAPVEMVTWHDCVQFCKALCKLEKVPEGSYRLPTEAEWEYTCRAGTKTPFCYGKILSHEMAHFGQMPYVGNTSTMPAGKFPPNAWGLHDMHGNVYEWCQDWFANYTGEAAVDPKGPARGVERSSRGGGWGIQAAYCRSANRCADAKPTYKMFALGVRIARDIQ